MKAMFESIKQFVREEDGAAGVEYALLLCLVAAVLTAFIPGISGAVQTIFTNIRTTLTTAAG